MAANDKGARPILYGRRKGKKLRPGRQRLVEKLLPALTIDIGAGLPSPEKLFAKPVSAIWLEVGFGAGEHLAWQAAANPDIGFIGVEPFRYGLARLVSVIDAEGLDNIRLFADDAALILDALPAASVARCFVLFPDPWPKRRHHKRRFIRGENLDRLARVLCDGAELRLASDDMDYARWMLAHVLAHAEFDWPAQRPADWRCRPDDWPPTRYEAKALQEGRRSLYFRFVRRPRRSRGASTEKP